MIELYFRSIISLALGLYADVCILRKPYLSWRVIILFLFSGPPSSTRVRKGLCLYIMSF